MRRGLVEPGIVVLLREGHLDRHGMKPHDRVLIGGLRRRRHVQRLLDHLQAAISLLPEPEMIGIGQVEREIDFLTGLQGLLKDRLEIRLDRVGQRLDRAIGRFFSLRERAASVRWVCSRTWLSRVTSAGVDVWDGGQFLDVGQQRLDLIAEPRASRSGSGSGPGTERPAPRAGRGRCGRSVGSRRQRGRVPLVQRLVASAIVSGGLREPGPDRAPAGWPAHCDRRGP